MHTFPLLQIYHVAIDTITISLLLGHVEDKPSSIEYLLKRDNTIPPWLAATYAISKVREAVQMATIEGLHQWQRACWYKLYTISLLIGQLKFA